MSIFSRKDNKRPAYLDTPLDEYKPRYTSLLNALEHEVAPGSQDVKALRVALPHQVFEVFYHSGQIKHVYKWNNYFNLGKRLGLRWNSEQLSQWVNAVQEESRNEALLYGAVRGIEESGAREVFGGLAVRWAAELSQAIQENIDDPGQPRAEYSVHIMEDPEQAAEIISWDFLQVNVYELCHFADAYNRICQEKMASLGITSPRDTFALNMDEEERRGFWENSGEFTKVIVDRTPGNFEVEDLYSEELGQRRDMVLTALEALAFDGNVLINGSPVEFSLEEGLPGLEELATLSHGDDTSNNLGEEYAREAVRVFTSAPRENVEPISEEESAFSTQGNALEESPELGEISYTPTEMGSVMFTPILMDAVAAEAFTSYQVEALEEAVYPLDAAGEKLRVVESRLEQLTEMYAQSSTEFNKLSMHRLLDNDLMDESQPTPRESPEEAETRDFADGGFFVLENLEKERGEINEVRRGLLEKLREPLATVADNPHGVLLEQVRESALRGIEATKNVVLPSTAPEALEQEKNELSKLDDVEVGE